MFFTLCLVSGRLSGSCSRLSSPLSSLVCKYSDLVLDLVLVLMVGCEDPFVRVLCIVRRRRGGGGETRGSLRGGENQGLSMRRGCEDCGEDDVDGDEDEPV